MELITQPKQKQVAGKERRRWPRFHIDVTIRATVRSGDLVKTVHGRGNNVSRGGMAAYIAIELAIGDAVDLQITLPYSSQCLFVTGIVRNRNSYCYGMEFVNITAAQAGELERSCRSLELTQ